MIYAIKGKEILSFARRNNFSKMNVNLERAFICTFRVIFGFSVSDATGDTETSTYDYMVALHQQLKTNYGFP